MKPALGALFLFSTSCKLLQAAPERILLGAQVWIEPGQTAAEIDSWFAQLEAAHMPVARLFMMWSYLETAPGVWDFALYDAAFRAAEKHHVGIVATLTPNGPPPFRHGDGTQGVGIVGSAEARSAGALYIQKIVERYQSSPALDSWLLVNEPGQAPAVQPLAVSSYRQYLARQYPDVAALNAGWGSAYTSFDEIAPAEKGGSWNASAAIDWWTFWREYQTAGLEWIAGEVKLHDSAHPLHINPHALVGNLAGVSDNLPAWRGFLDSLGCSIHPGWHFGLLPRDRFALGVSYVNDLVAGAIEPKPHWVTELQGGNNIYSAVRPMDPDPADIAQWIWTSVGSGARRVIFWLLNARRSGVEAGEWSMLDFDQHPSVRLGTAASIARTIDAHADFFASAHAVRPPVTLILSLETMTLQQHYGMHDQPGRGAESHIIETLGLYEALSRLGAPPHVKHFDDYDWLAKSATPRAAILGDLRAMTETQMAKLDAFVANGNTLLVTGLTGFYDPHAKAWPLAGFPLARVTGARWKEVHYLGERVDLSLSPPWPALEARLWQSSLMPVEASAIGVRGGEVVATDRRVQGGGRVIWVPALIGHGAWFGNAASLTEFLQRLLPPADGREFTFAGDTPGCLLRILRNDAEAVTVVTNGANSPVTCTIRLPSPAQSTPLWGDAPEPGDGLAHLRLGPKETSVLLWKL